MNIYVPYWLVVTVLAVVGLFLLCAVLYWTGRMLVELPRLPLKLFKVYRAFILFLWDEEERRACIARANKPAPVWHDGTSPANCIDSDAE